MFARKNKRPAAPKGQGAAAAKQVSGISYAAKNAPERPGRVAVRTGSRRCV